MVKIMKQMKAAGRAAPKRQIVKTKTIRSSVPVAFAEIHRNVRPRIVSGADGSVVVHHTEYVGPVRSDANNQFAYDAYKLDFTNAETFPWGSRFSQLYESQELLGLEVIFKSLTPTNVSGAIEIGIDYDAADDVDNITEQQLLNWESTVESNVWNSISHKSTAANLRKFSRQRYTNDDGGDDRFSSFGNLIVATTTTNIAALVGTTGFQIVTFGHLYIRYSVRLSTPQLMGVGSGLKRPLATAPQTLKNYVLTSAITSSTNALTGIDSASAPTVTTFEEDTFVKVVAAGTNNWLADGLNNVFAPVGTPLLVFTKDFEGMLNFTMDCASLGGTGAPSISQFVEANGTTLQGVDRPFVQNNLFANVQTIASTASNVYSTLAYVTAVAGTAWRIALPLYTAAVGNIKSLGLSPGRKFGASKTSVGLSASQLKNRIQFPVSETSYTPKDGICLT